MKHKELEDIIEKQLAILKEDRYRITNSSIPLIAAGLLLISKNLESIDDTLTKIMVRLEE